MSHKSQSKPAQKNIAKENSKPHLHKRTELAILIDNVLRWTSFFQVTSNVQKSWEQHSDIDALMKGIANLQASEQKKFFKDRKSSIESFLKWLNENGVQYEGVEIAEFEGFELGLKATKDFAEGSLILTIPSKIMMTEDSAKNSALSELLAIDPLLQNMPNITLALFLLLEKSNPESFWKPYIDILPNKYSTVLFFTPEEFAEMRPSPVFEFGLKLYRSIARQYAYFYNKLNSLNLPQLKSLKDIFTFDNYRWAVSTVMTRQNNISLGDAEITAFIPLWDMCNHENGKITTDFNKELDRGECFALRDFKPGEQIFIFYGVRPNSDLFLHNGFVYPENQHETLCLNFGVSFNDPLKEPKLELLTKLGLLSVTQYPLYPGDSPIGAELLAFIRIFNMNQEQLTKWLSSSSTADLVSSEEDSARAVGVEIDRCAYTFLLTRCKLLLAGYKKCEEPVSAQRVIIKLLKDCEERILEGAIKYLTETLAEMPTAEK